MITREIKSTIVLSLTVSISLFCLIDFHFIDEVVVYGNLTVKKAFLIKTFIFTMIFMTVIVGLQLLLLLKITLFDK